MSKSMGNVVSPIDMIDKYGTDVSRITMYFAAPSEREILWSEEGITGATRFLNRIYNFAKLVQDIKIEPGVKMETLSAYELNTYRKLQQTVKKVEEDIKTLQLNTAIASMMELLNVMDHLVASKSNVLRGCVETLTKIMAPFVPHLSEEIWSILGYKESIFRSRWPEYDKKALEEEEITFVIQVNGRMRASIIIPVNTPEALCRERALSQEKVKKFIAGKTIIKEIFVPNKLINIVVR